MNNNEILETIDCTPTWQSLLFPMLEVYAHHKAKVKNSYSITPKTQHAIDAIKDLNIEFEKMAQAADKWNEHIKSLK